jgi:hypothetical protein
MALVSGTANDRPWGARGIRGALTAGLLASACALSVQALAATAASAETLTATCANLQAKLTAAAAKAPNHGEGDVVQLEGLCDATSLKGKLGVTIPKESNFTLEGTPDTTSGFDGKAWNTRCCTRSKAKRPARSRSPT